MLNSNKKSRRASPVNDDDGHNTKTVQENRETGYGMSTKGQETSSHMSSGNSSNFDMHPYQQEENSRQFSHVPHPR